MSSPDAEFSPDRYRGYLLVVVRRMWTRTLQTWFQPEDIVHYAIADAVKDHAKFGGNTPGAYRGWLCKILTNTIKDKEKELRRQKRDIRLELSIEAEVERSSGGLERFPAAGPSPSSAAAREEHLVRLWDALARLSDARFTAITLHHLDGLSIEATAVAMNRTKASVAGLLRRGLEDLQEFMGEGADDA